jgi:tetratricopeptide (TPR) repeat protein
LARLRFWGEFAVCAAVIAPDLLTPFQRNERAGSRMRTASALLLIIFCAWRGADLATDHYYFSHGTVSSFGLGLALPPADRAIQFIRDNHLPGQVFNDYNAGGYLTWAAAPSFEGQPDRYPVFIDGRGDPYGADVIFLAARLAGQPPFGPDWQWAIKRWNIHTVVSRLSRQSGMEGIAMQGFCQSGAFRLAYLDDAMAVFTRAEDLHTPPLDCRTVQVPPPAATASRWERYNTFATAGRIYFLLGRYQEAERAWRQASEVFGEGAEMHLAFAEMRRVQGRLGEAEREFRMAVKDLPVATTFGALGNLLTWEGRAPEADEYLRAAAARTPRGFEQWMMVGRNDLLMERPQEALDAFNRALRMNPYEGDSAYMIIGPMSELMGLKGKALLQLKRPQEAVQAFETSRQMSWEGMPADFKVLMAEAYRQAGRTADAERLLRELGRPGISSSPLQEMNRLLREPRP